MSFVKRCILSTSAALKSRCSWRAVLAPSSVWVRWSSTDDSGAPTEGHNDLQPSIPMYKMPEGETVTIRRARLLYQCRKRGMLENGILLSTFAHRYLNKLTEAELIQLDVIINQPSNDWDIYHWMTGKTEVPSEYDNNMMDMLKKHVRNDDMEVRLQQPDLS